jgi:hypothetical protein
MELPLVRDIDPRALMVQARRVAAVMDSLGAPLSTGDAHGPETSEAIQRGLDQYCLVEVHINPEMRVKVARGPARAVLTGQAWRPFLVKVRNEAGTTAVLRATRAKAQGWLDLLMFDDPPLLRALSGLPLEYRIVRLYSHDVGRREASLAFDVGQGSQDLGFRNEVPVLFDCRPAD